MKGLAIAAASAAVIGLTACSHNSAPSAAPASHGTGTPIAPVSCGQQYRTWKHGQGKGLMSALNDVSSAATAGDAQVLTATLEQAKPAVARAARHPIPACADPRGYWSVLLMHVNAAVASKGSASSVRAALQDVPKIQHKLTTEVKQTAQ
ncbi:MAG TPA: hypothetical protein VGF54_02095 [Streptosporangiaceae bacterium]|jgi:hypothetical protein